MERKKIMEEMPAEGKPTDNMHGATGMYGLPLEVKYCKKCIISNQRPPSVVEFKNKDSHKERTIDFNEEGICEACQFAEKKKNDEINWQEREEEFKKMLKRFRSKEGHHDCVVPGSGGKDSVKAAYYLRYKYNMNPLLVTWPPHIYTKVGVENYTAWLNAGFDGVPYYPNQKVHRLVTRFAFENLCHPFQPFMIGQKNLAPKMSAIFKIPLVIFGENEAEYGNPVGDNNSPTRDLSFFSTDDEFDQIYLGGVSVKDLMKYHGLTRADLDPYLPVSPKLLKEVGTEVHYLGYYTKWDPQESYYFSVENTDFMPNEERTEGSYGKYSSFDDKIDWFHYYTYFVKFGLGRATDDASQEIRNGHITRDEGVRLVRRFDGEFPKQYMKDNLGYMDITEQRFYEVIDAARPPHLWEKRGDEWILKHQVDFLTDEEK